MALPDQPYAWAPSEARKPRESGGGVFSNTSHAVVNDDRKSATESAIHNMDHAARFIARAQNDLLVLRARLDHNRLERLHKGLRELIDQYESALK
jgi:hypothetical protein